jgi:hypothetical protein
MNFTAAQNEMVETLNASGFKDLASMAESLIERWIGTTEAFLSALRSMSRDVTAAVDAVENGFNTVRDEYMVRDAGAVAALGASRRVLEREMVMFCAMLRSHHDLQFSATDMLQPAQS